MYLGGGVQLSGKTLGERKKAEKDLKNQYDAWVLAREAKPAGTDMEVQIGQPVSAAQVQPVMPSVDNALTCQQAAPGFMYEPV